MLKLLFSVFVEAIVGISLAGFLLAVIVPALTYYRPADTTANSGLVIIGVIVVVTIGVLFRPGSAINRRIRR